MPEQAAAVASPMSKILKRFACGKVVRCEGLEAEAPIYRGPTNGPNELESRREQPRVVLHAVENDQPGADLRPPSAHSL